MAAIQDASPARPDSWRDDIRRGGDRRAPCTFALASGGGDCAGGCKHTADPGNLATAQPKDHRRAQEHGKRQSKQESSIPLEHDSQSREMGADSPRHQARGQSCTLYGGSWNQEQPDGNQLKDPGSGPFPGFDAKSGEDELGFCGAAELEAERLAQNEGGENLKPEGDATMSVAGRLHAVESLTAANPYTTQFNAFPA